jgi:hypothetical protein
LTQRLREAAHDLRNWTSQLFVNWERFEQIAVQLDLRRDVLVPVRFETLGDSDQPGNTTVALLGLRQMGDRWHIALGHGPDDARHWDDRWTWLPRAQWERHHCTLAASRMEHLLEALLSAADEIAGETERAAAVVAKHLHHLNVAPLPQPAAKDN